MARVSAAAETADESELQQVVVVVVFVVKLSQQQVPVLHAQVAVIGLMASRVHSRAVFVFKHSPRIRILLF